MRPPTPTRRDREILLDTTLRLYTARRALQSSTINEMHLLTECVSDAFEVTTALLYTEPDAIATTLN